MNTPAGISANITTAAGNNANITTVLETMQTSQMAGSSGNVTTVAGIASDVTACKLQQCKHYICWWRY